MKNLFIALILTLCSLSSFGQTNQTEISKQSEVGQKPKQTVTVAKPTPTGLRKKATYSGVLVQVTKTDNPLQLINPFAPARYGSGFSNLRVDPVTGKAQGISLLTIGY